MKDMTVGKVELVTGASRLVSADLPQEMPRLSLRQVFAMHAPAPPNWWKVRSPLDTARWAWAWADAMLQTQNDRTTPDTAEQPGVARPR